MEKKWQIKLSTFRTTLRLSNFLMNIHEYVLMQAVMSQQSAAAAGAPRCVQLPAGRQENRPGCVMELLNVNEHGIVMAHVSCFCYSITVWRLTYERMVITLLDYTLYRLQIT